MIYRRLLLLLTLLIFLAVPAGAQRRTAPSPQKAFAMSLLLPGLGHQYAHGNWKNTGTLYALADAGLWVTLWGRQQRYQNLTDSYKTLAGTYAGATTDGQDRRFYVNLASYRSSDEYLETQLRNRNWDQINYVRDPRNQWEWDTEAHFLQFAETRNDAETVRRQRPVIITMLVVNRVLSGFMAARAAGKEARAVQTELGLAPAPVGERLPMIQLSARF